MCPLVSIIVPNYNHARYLTERLDSIFNQTFQNFELIILDDCSTDNSREIIEKYRNHPKVSNIVYNETNGGTSYKQWKKGIAYAKGDLIWIAESDDVADIHFLEYLVPHFEDKELSMGFSNVHFFSESIDAMYSVNEDNFVLHKGIDLIRNRMLSGNAVCNASMVIFRNNVYSLIDQDVWSNMKLAGDWMLWTQIASKGYVAEQLSVMDYCRRHDSNATSRFRLLGCDFTEGVKVLEFGKAVCCNSYDREKLQHDWYHHYMIWTRDCSSIVKVKIVKSFILSDFRIGLYFCKNIVRRRLKKIKNIVIHKCCNICH